MDQWTKEQAEEFCQDAKVVFQSYYKYNFRFKGEKTDILS